MGLPIIFNILYENYFDGISYHGIPYHRKKNSQKNGKMIKVKTKQNKNLANFSILNPESFFI